LVIMWKNTTNVVDAVEKLELYPFHS
jgi:hypothetical protein